MTKIMRYVDEIPIDIYTQIPNVVYNEYKNTLMELSRYADKLATNKIKKPSEGSPIIKRYGNSKYFIYKSKDDPFDVEYNVMCRIQTLRLNSVISAFLKKEDLEFDIHQLINRQAFLNYIAKEFSQIVN